MIIRISKRGLVVGAALVVVAAMVLALPFALYTYRFISDLRSSQEKWAERGSGDYEIVAASNSLTDCTAGWNTVRIAGGKVVAGQNSEHSICPHDEFAKLTVEALFARIWDECIRRRPLESPFPVCNVSYDEQLGFPRRLDTYSFDENSEYLPSVTVKSVTLAP